MYIITMIILICNYVCYANSKVGDFVYNVACIRRRGEMWFINCSCVYTKDYSPFCQPQLQITVVLLAIQDQLRSKCNELLQQSYVIFVQPCSYRVIITSVLATYNFRLTAHSYSMLQYRQGFCYQCKLLYNVLSYATYECSFRVLI